MSNTQAKIKKDSAISNKIDTTIGLYIVVIILAAVKQLYGVRQHLDIPFFDETEYLQKGVGLATHAYNNWGPSYNLWYWLLSNICPDSIDVFYLNFGLLMIALPIALFVFLISFTVEKNIALIATLSFLMQPILVSNFTFVSHFCLLIILIAFVLINQSENKETKLLLAMTASYICMYARQEFLLIFVTLLFIWMIVIAMQKRITYTPAYLILMICTGGLYALFGFISFKAQGIDRSLFAFKQHFYTNYIFWTKQPLTLDEFDALDIFHGSKTMLQCIFANPELFLKHVATNILNYLINLYKYTENWILPQPIFHYLGKVKHVLFLLLIGMFSFLTIKKRSYSNVIVYVQQQKFTTLLTATYFIWSFFSVFLIFPERHYILLQFAWWILLILLLTKDYSSFIRKPIPFYAIVLLLLFFNPQAKSISYYHNMRLDSTHQPNLKTIEFLRKNNSKDTTILFTSERGFDAYLPKNYKELFLEQDDVRPYVRNGSVDIMRYFHDKKVNIIFMNEKMQRLFVQTLGSTGTLLLKDPEKVGFRKQIIDKDLQAYLLIRI